MSAQIRELVRGVREILTRSFPSFAAKIRVRGVSIEWLRTYEHESGKHRPEI